MKCSLVVLYIASCVVISVLTCQNNRQSIFSKKRRPHLAGLILARGGSKGILLKNLAKVNHVPLVTLTIRQILVAGAFDSVWVSTNNYYIFQEVDKAGVNVHWRSEESATDTASSLFAVQEFLGKHPEVDVVALVQCTSPFVKAKYLQEAAAFIRSGRDCVFSVTRSFSLRWKRISNIIVPLNFNFKRRPRRQDWEGELIENGMFYFAARRLISDGSFQNHE